MWETIGALLLVIGAFFVLVAAFGLLRLPDVLARMQATSKATTLGLSTIMAAAALHAGSVDTTVRVLLIILFTFMTTPIGAHMLGRAAYRTAAGGWRSLVVDELGTAGEQTSRMERLAEGVPGTDPPGVRVLVCTGPAEDAGALLAQARLDRHFVRSDVDVMAPPDGQEPYQLTAWIQITLDRLTGGRHGLVVMGQPAGRPGLSLAARRLLQRAPVPVWLAAAESHMASGPLLVALDVPTDRRRARHTQTALRNAAALASASGRALHVAHAWTPFGSDLLVPRLRSDAVGEYIEAEAIRARAALDHLLAHAMLATRPAAVHVERGHPRDVIPAVAARMGAGVVVMGTRGRRFSLTAHLMPTLAEVVVPRLDCAALIVGPGSELEWSDTRAPEDDRFGAPMAVRRRRA